MYAMKYMSKAVCIEKDAVRNVLREMDILMKLDHSFLVNLWFTFQDEEDLFVVVDLLLGGDFRYHLQQGIKFSEDVVRFYIGEIALALEYLRSHRIIHRDIKPDNLLLDVKGHVHLTDFNVATVMEDDNTLATSMSGTKPYMAPEIFKTSLGKQRGYSYEVDWWSLGISIFEILRGKRPYHINSNTNLSDVIQMFESSCLMCPSSWTKNFKNLIQKLLHIDPKIRLNTVEQLKECELMRSLDWESLSRKEISVPFIPSKDHLNCDPTYELEEMIIEPNPLHKKKKRLAKQNSNKVCTGNVVLTPMQMKLETLNRKFIPYNREREKHIKEQRNLHNFDDDKIPEESETVETVELQNGVGTKEKAQTNFLEEKSSCHEDEMKLVADVKDPEKVSEETKVKGECLSESQAPEIPGINGKSLAGKVSKDAEVERKSWPRESERDELRFKRKSFPNEKARLIELATERAKRQSDIVIEQSENNENKEIVDKTMERKESVKEDKESLLQNDQVDAESQKNHTVPTI
ncbi:serine/threonine-protein kinase 32A-like [Dendronephthya gigantea]|uniref:serine/threonine-protein kinase 32A-like n=1 Tax=Dendronephthya gigantea TaxID=151771 RepID=UPI00106B8F8B|nr:serine/threonine-protein kinase 32A-like [Dendronephthya gigantea]